MTQNKILWPDAATINLKRKYILFFSYSTKSKYDLSKLYIVLNRFYKDCVKIILRNLYYYSCEDLFYQDNFWPQAVCSLWLFCEVPHTINSHGHFKFVFKAL